MYAFSFWHTYYDSAFTSHPFKIPNIFYSDLQISIQAGKWPILPSLPQLPKLFQLLEEAVLIEDNWLGCIYSSTEMQEIQSEINLIIVNLQCEKRYGQEFWKNNPRRIQSSIVHFYIYFKIFITTLLPNDCDCLLEANRKDRLVFSLKKLEVLVNDILMNLKQVHQFLFQPLFSQEQTLVKQFFTDFLQILHNLPSISKQKLAKASKLMEFICITNPLEADKLQSNQQQPSIRRKNATAIGTKKEKVKRRSEQKSKKESQVDAIDNYEDHFSKNKMSIEFSPPKDIAKKFQIFRFKQKVRKYSFYRNLKKQTTSSFDTKDKTGSVIKQRSPSNQRSLSFVDQFQIKRTETVPAGRTKQPSFYVQKRSREVSYKSIHQRDKSPSMTMYYDKEEIQHQRLAKMMKKKATKIPITTMPVSNVRDLGNGKRRGWGVVRQWFEARLAGRKLRRLFNQI